MQISIGEVVNELLPFTNDINVSIMNDVPFLRARISTESAYTRAYLYVVQTAYGKYACADSRDDVNGDRFFPTGGIKHPFIVETDIVRSMFGCTGDDISYKYETVVTDLDLSGFVDHLHYLLNYYEIIRFDPKNLSQKVADLGFTSTRIRRTIEKEFSSKKCHLGTIKDLSDIILRRHERFSLGNLSSKETAVIVAKLKALGVTVKIDPENCFYTISFDRRKGG